MLLALNEAMVRGGGAKVTKPGDCWTMGQILAFVSSHRLLGSVMCDPPAGIGHGAEIGGLELGELVTFTTTPVGGGPTGSPSVDDRQARVTNDGRIGCKTLGQMH